MAEINFRIVHVPTEKFLSDEEVKWNVRPYMNTLKSHIKSCGLIDVNISLLNVKNSEDIEDYPEIEETVYQVQAKLSVNCPAYGKPVYYQEFCKRWKEEFYPLSSPTLVLYESSCFINTHSSCDEKEYRSLAFGTMPYNGEFHEYAGIRYPDYVIFYHDTRNVCIKCWDLELKFSYNNIRHIFVNIGSCEVLFDLCNPPLVFRPETKLNRYIGTYTIDHRTAQVKKNSLYNFMGFTSRQNSGNEEIDVDTFGRSNVLKVTFRNASEVEEIIGRIHFRCSEKPIYYVFVSTIQKPKPIHLNVELPHFGCTYLLNAMFKRSFTLVAQASNINASLEEIRRMCEENGDSLEKSLTLVLTAIDSGKLVNYWHAIERQYRCYLTHKDEINFGHYLVPEKCRMIRRITLSPTRQMLWAPEVMFSNRVLRNFDSEYALRVSFRDDNNIKLSLFASYADENIFDLSIRQPMFNGIRIGNRHYEFLAWSNSQIRHHGIWMYARDSNGNTVKDIRAWMGNFSHIHSVPKYMARMGQCFSQTEDTISVPLDPRYVRTEKDIEGGLDPRSRKPYCFSDGVGRISTSLAKKVHDVLGHDKLCSAFQIRYGGYKGMLVIDPTLKDADIVFRESMKKFDSPNSTRLEIAKTSAPISLQLNRPFITILNDLGVRHRTFLKLQEEMLSTLTDMLFDEQKAASFLRSKTPNQLFNYKDLYHSGIYLTTEPFFRSLLLALHRVHVEKIKSKANIAIDPNQGRNMLGVLDETGLLNENEVFVQYTKDINYGETTRDTIVLKRVVLVTKNPCLLPGDVRKFNAVDIPELHHIVDCIVFPQRGARPHPNEMAGSDLDGDEYAVLWNDDLIFHRPNEPPGHFPSAQEKLNYNITDADMIDFLAKYIRNDQVGTIASAHLANADNFSIFSETCITIAKKFSYAVDYAKTGVSRHLEPEDKPGRFPDFMERNYKESYRSDKALGKMYRVAKDYESENQDASITYLDVKADPDLEYPGWEKYKDNAIKSRNKYNTLLRAILRNYGIQHEAEVFSGAFTNLHCRFQERKDRDEIEKVVVRCIKRLSKCMNDEFLEEFKEAANAKEIDVRIKQKASAWYLVTYSDSNAKFLSFPWTVHRYLVILKTEKTDVIALNFSPVVDEMDKQIKNCELKDILPFDIDSYLWKDYKYIFKRKLVELAFRVLVFWADDEEILPKHGRQGLMPLETFLRIFLHVAELENYVIHKRRSSTSNGSRFSPAALCLKFFRFCLTLRFYNQREVKDVLPFTVYKYTKLSKRAVVTYHRFALLGKFRILYFNVIVEERGIQMNPVHIDSKIFPRIPIDPELIRKAEEALMKCSMVEFVSLREIKQTKKVVVSATGSEQSLKTLKSFLRKKHVWLRELFTTGDLPSEVITVF